jgi:hypothetical protein
MQKGYRGDQVRQRKLWQPVRRQVVQWRREYQAARSTHGVAPLLGYGDGGSFLVVRRRTASADLVESYRFTGKSAAIFRYCDQRRSLEDIFKMFAPFSPGKIEAFVNDLVAKRLMFREGDQVLGLAVNEDIRGLVAPEAGQA